MPETFESDREPDDDDFVDEDENEHVVPPPRHRRKRGEDVPDAPVENAGDIPLLQHAGSGKANTVTYLKITRLDGPRGVRGVKGKLPPESTYEDVARRFGNGTYKIEGCNYRHRMLAREEGLEIAIPGFDDDGEVGRNQPPVQQGGGGQFGLHGMQMIARMSDKNTEAVRDQATSMSEQVQLMANRTLEMMTAFTTAQRETERSSHESNMQNMQQFFAAIMAQTTLAHSQQMEMLTAMNDRDRKAQIDPMAMVKMFMDGMKAGGELGGGGEDVEPWVAALKEGTGMLGHIASLAHAPAIQTAVSNGKQALPPQPKPRALGAGEEMPDPSTTGRRRRKKRLPFNRDEIRGMARLRQTLRQRGISLADYLEQTREAVQQAPDSALFEDDAEDDGPDGSEDHAAHSSEDSPT